MSEKKKGKRKSKGDNPKTDGAKKAIGKQKRKKLKWEARAMMQQQTAM